MIRSSDAAQRTWGGPLAACGQPTSRAPVAALFRVPHASKSGAAVGISAAEVAILVYSRLQGQQLRDHGTRMLRPVIQLATTVLENPAFLRAPQHCSVNHQSERKRQSYSQDERHRRDPLPSTRQQP